MIKNRRAYHDYRIHKTYEAGLCLKGTEVKDIKARKFDLRGWYVKIENGELFMAKDGTIKLLLNRAEIDKLLTLKEFELIPLKLYLKGAIIKLELGLCKRKQIKGKKWKLIEAERSKNSGYYNN